ncbi:MAG: hypothetical protein NT075_02275 [Chloroflexi bacterium]|nr:hypothetical protein [Chloroflexota bacterium]
MTNYSATEVLFKDATESMVKNFGRSTLYEYFSDWVIYRNLEPMDKRLPGLKAAGYKMGLAGDRIPRKLEKDYAKAALWFGEEAQRLRGVKTPIKEIILIGDTLLNDGTAYHNMRSLSGLPGACFIGCEKTAQEPSVEIDDKDQVYSANRWSALGAWAQWALDSGLRLDANTLVVVDIDKTALGAKGRNDQVIDKARLEGLYRTMDAVLGEDFDYNSFERAYAEFNRTPYHLLTEDNQDYLAYICLVVNTGLIHFDEVVQEIKKKSLDNFDQFLRWVGSRMMIKHNGGEAFRQVHEAVVASVRSGDPTPFKRFRREEFISTVAHMGNMADDSSVADLLKNEITLTEEVCELSEWLKGRNCLQLCLSDKPDEASRPNAHASAHLAPLHKIATHRVGVDIRQMLDKLK